MKRILHLTILCMLLSLIAVPVCAEENQLLGAAEFLENAVELASEPFTVTLKEEGEMEPLLSGETVEAEVGGENRQVLEITADGENILIGEGLLAAETDNTFYGLDVKPLFRGEVSLREMLQQTELPSFLVETYEKYSDQLSLGANAVIIPSRNGVSFSVNFDGMQLANTVLGILNSEEMREIFQSGQFESLNRMVREACYGGIRNQNSFAAAGTVSMEENRLTASVTGAVNYQQSFNVYVQVTNLGSSDVLPDFRIQARVDRDQLLVEGKNGVFSGKISRENGRGHEFSGIYDLSSDGAMFSMEVLNAKDQEVEFLFQGNLNSHGLNAVLTVDDVAATFSLKKEGAEYLLNMNIPGSGILYKLSLSPEGIHAYHYARFAMRQAKIDLSFTDPGVKAYYRTYNDIYALNSYQGKLLYVSTHLGDSSNPTTYEGQLFSLKADGKELHLDYWEMEEEEELPFDYDTMTIGEVEGLEPEVTLHAVQEEDQLNATLSGGYDSITLTLQQMKDTKSLKSVEVQPVSLLEIYSLMSEVLFGN